MDGNKLEEERMPSEIEAFQLQEELLQRKQMTERQCVACKAVSAVIFLGIGAFHGVRAAQLW